MATTIEQYIEEDKQRRLQLHEEFLTTQKDNLNVLLKEHDWVSCTCVKAGGNMKGIKLYGAHFKVETETEDILSICIVFIFNKKDNTLEFPDQDQDNHIKVTADNLVSRIVYSYLNEGKKA
jgi:hypothetical protein